MQRRLYPSFLLKLLIYKGFLVNLLSMTRPLQLIYLTLFLAMGLSVNAQIDNGGFEGNSGLPNNTGQFNLVNAWSNAGRSMSSPDY